MFDEKCVYFWPVGTGDSTTFVVRNNKIVFQVDLRHAEKSDDDDNGYAPIIDRLVEHLPKVNGKPYLSAFAITHPDKDHIQGFTELLKRVQIGELWFSPRIFREHDDDPKSLGDDAKAFREEAHRRVTATIKAKGDPGSGDRVRLIGYDTLLKEEKYQGFPLAFFSVPGHTVTFLDGEDLSGEFRVFIHAPFKQDDDENLGDRNDTSLAMQVVFGDDPSAGGVLLFGDHKYPVVRKIIDVSVANKGKENLHWQVLLSPHHCSKSVLYQDEDGKLVLKQDLVDDLSALQIGEGYIIASANCIPSSNKDGDNPPHAIAKKRYQEMAAGGFLCTHDDGEAGEPLRFRVSGSDLEYDDSKRAEKRAGTRDALAVAIAEARGSNQAPTTKVGFGWSS